MRLQGNKIFLTSIEDKDTDLIVKWRNSSHVMNNFIDKNPLTPEIHRNWLKNKVETGLVHQFVIFVKDSGRPIGSVYLRDVDLNEKSAEYGIFIGETDALGYGYGTEACQMMVDYSRDELKLSKLKLRLRQENKTAHKLYLNCGFEDKETIDGILFMERKLDEN